MSAAIASIIGATGMIGRELVRQLIDNDHYETIRILVRRPMESPHPKVKVKLVDFSDAESIKLAMDGSEVLFCAIGTTQKKVKGDRQAYTKIDFDIPVRAARACREIGCRKIVVITSVGANSKSSNFYLKLKGHVEDAISLEPFASIHFFQPSLLLGKREERRPVEKISMGLMKVFAPLLIGGLRKYRPVTDQQLAAAMIRAALSPSVGVQRHLYDQIVE
ncbi:MAG: NAD(P)H-binding protein [Chitinophagaceae bacterium]